MENLTPAARARILDILRQGHDLTLATIRPDGYPQATTVSYVHDGLTLYAGVGLGSQKATNIQQNNKVSATINLGYDDWDKIRGISLGGTAEFVQGVEQIGRIEQAFLHKFPDIVTIMPETGTLPWPGLLFLRIRPTVVSLLDYSQGFGHTELYGIAPDA